MVIIDIPGGVWVESGMLRVDARPLAVLEEGMGIGVHQVVGGGMPDVPDVADGGLVGIASLLLDLVLKVGVDFGGSAEVFDNSLHCGEH